MTAPASKSVLMIHRALNDHWVGDGFPVRTLFSYANLDQQISPFLLLDYAGPAEFASTDQRRGVGEHPHRGIETVTIVYRGEVEHHDSSGGGGVIGPGDVQWMTAASGVVHEERHGEAFARTGGMFEMMQLWVNLPAKDKQSPPRYQAITATQIPEVALPDGAGSVHVVAGVFDGVKGPALTFTVLNVWRLTIATDERFTLDVPTGHTTLIASRKGSARIDGTDVLNHAELALLDPDGTHIAIDQGSGSELLVMTGEPLGEPIAGQGPFVMNTREELRQATYDYLSGKMGRLTNRD